MAEDDLAGVGVLVTRPEHQAAELVAAITARGGSAIVLPVLEITPRDSRDIADEAGQLLEPDIVVYVSSNAAQFGLDYAGDAQLAVVGPATAQTVEALGRNVDVRSSDGYDSEHLLATTELRDVKGKIVRIVRGSRGRELIADTLRERGAKVEYLAVYDRQVPQYTAEDIDELEQQWRRGAVDVVTIMSVESLQNLLTILPDWCRSELANTPLVTPASRVIMEALEQLPGIPTTLARGPQASDMVDAIVKWKETSTG